MGGSEPRGLVNIGGTCYMNTVLQCFYHIKELSENLLRVENKNKRYFDNKPFTKSYLTVVKGLLNEQKSSYAFEPDKFLNSLIRINQGYRNVFGSDPKDVVSDILFQIHQELSKQDKLIQLNKYYDPRERMQLFDFYKKQEEEDPTIISKLFNWCNQMKKKCLNCNNEFYDFQYEFMLFFYLEKIYKDQSMGYTRLDLVKNCFENTFKKNIDYITCPYCRKKVKGEIENCICVLPKYFIIILDRGTNDKFNCFINFDEIIDINKFTNQIDTPKYCPIYELLCATFLIGRSGYGHTVAVCKEKDKYYLFNDAYTKICKIEDFKNEKPFLLFYKRIYD